MAIRISFKTTGCRLNQAETAVMRAEAIAAGCVIVPFGDTCDICVIHGCVVTGNAEKNTWRFLRAVKRSGKAQFTILAGCPAELAGRISAYQPDLTLKQGEKFNIAALLDRLNMADIPREQTPTPTAPVFDTRRAMVRIQDGCDYRCAYCIVPYTRGPSRSRPLPEIIDEINRLTEAGYREAVLTGANAGCYEWQGQKLPDLLAAVATQTDIERLRLSSMEFSRTIYPVVDVMAGSRKFCRFLHVPLQSGADPILHSMRRRYNRYQYADFIKHAISKLTPLGLGTDIITGYPGETDSDFQATVDMINDLPFNNLHVFTYSPRPGTPAADMPDLTSEQTKKQRRQYLIELGQAKRIAFARSMIGQTMEVLVEKVDGEGAGSGWTGEYLPARITSSTPDALIRNSIVKCVPSAAAGIVLQTKTISPGAS